jgi:hypothetical protein
MGRQHESAHNRRYHVVRFELGHSIVPPLTKAPWPLRALKVVLALTLGTPATLLWLPSMLPFAIFVPLMLVRDAIAGHANIDDLRVMAIAFAGTMGLAGFWLWVFDHPGRSVRMHRVIGLFWLAGAVEMVVYLRALPDLSSTWFAAAVALPVAVVAMGFAMIVRPRPPQQVRRSGPSSDAARLG